MFGHLDAVRDVEFSPDRSTLASAGDDHAIRLWDVGTGTPRGAPLDGVDASVTRIRFSSDGRLLAAVVDDTSDTLRVWDVASGTAITDLPTDGALDVAFSAGDRSLVVLNDYGEIREWDTHNYLDPLAAICALDGPPDESEWKRFATIRMPDVCR